MYLKDCWWGLKYDTFTLTLVCLMQPWEYWTELHQFCSPEENSQPAEPPLPKSCCHGKPGCADSAFVHGALILGENSPLLLLWRTAHFFSLKVHKDDAEERVCREEAAEGTKKSEEELEMENVSLTLSFSYHNFPLSKYWKVEHFQPPPVGGLRNKRKIFLLFLPLFQLILPPGDYITLNALQLLTRMIYRTLKSICAALNYGKLRVPSDCHRSQLASAAAAAAGGPSAARWWRRVDRAQPELCPTRGREPEEAVVWYEPPRSPWCLVNNSEKLPALLCLSLWGWTWPCLQRLRCSLSICNGITPKKGQRCGGGLHIGLHCGDIALDLGEGKGNCAITWLYFFKRCESNAEVCYKGPGASVMCGCGNIRKAEKVNDNHDQELHRSSWTRTQNGWRVGGPLPTWETTVEVAWQSSAAWTQLWTKTRVGERSREKSHPWITVPGLRLQMLCMQNWTESPRGNSIPRKIQVQADPRGPGFGFRWLCVTRWHTL